MVGKNRNRFEPSITKNGKSKSRLSQKNVRVSCCTSWCDPPQIDYAIKDQIIFKIYEPKSLEVSNYEST